MASKGGSSQLRTAEDHRHPSKEAVQQQCLKFLRVAEAQDNGCEVLVPVTMKMKVNPVIETNCELSHTDQVDQ